MTEKITAKQFREMNAEPKTESDLQIAVATYLRNKYPDLIFHSDFGSGIKMTMGQAVKNSKQQSGHKWLDLFIAHPNNGYSGMMIELKKSGTRLKKLNGEWANDHIKEQNETIGMLILRGYFACFAVGYTEAINRIEEYLPSYLSSPF